MSSPFLLGTFVTVLLLSGFTAQSYAAPEEGVTPPNQSKRITQAERQAAAERAKAKGFVAPAVTAPATVPATVPSETKEIGNTKVNDGGPAK